MKKTLLLLSIVILMFSLVLTGCSTSNEAATTVDPGTTTNEETAGEETTTTVEDEEQVFTLEELAKYNGKDGEKAYIAVDGVVYDVTDVPQWTEGEHNSFEAGQDLTEEIKTVSPHGISKLNGLPVVGKLE